MVSLYTVSYGRCERMKVKWMGLTEKMRKRVTIYNEKTLCCTADGILMLGWGKTCRLKIMYLIKIYN